MSGLTPSKIPYLPHNWPVVTGCTPCSLACENCWSKAIHERFNPGKPKVMIVKGPGWVDLSKADALELARADGFSSVEEMIRFFEDTYCLPFEGVCIKW